MCVDSEAILCTMDFGPLIRSLFGPNVSPGLVEFLVEALINQSLSGVEHIVKADRFVVKGGVGILSTVATLIYHQLSHGLRVVAKLRPIALSNHGIATVLS